MSPVLEAFFKGQEGQTSLIKQVREIADKSEEAKQRQQQIDELIKQHGIENKHNMDQLDLQHQIHKLTVEKNNREAMRQFSSDVFNEVIPKQGQFGPPTTGLMSILGLPPVAPNGANLPGGAPDIGAMAIPGIGTLPIQQPGQWQDNPTQNMSVPGQPDIVIPTPARTKSQVESDQAVNTARRTAEAILPTEIKKYEATVGSHDKMLDEFKRYNLEAQLGIKDQQLQQQQQQFTDRLAQADRLYQMGLMSKEGIAKENGDYKALAAHAFMTPEQWGEYIKNSAIGSATGQLDMKDIIPQARGEVQSFQQSQKLSSLDKKDANDFMGKVGTAASFVNLGKRLGEMLKGNDSKDTRIANAVRGLPIISSYSDPVQKFNAIITPTLSAFETLQGYNVKRGGTNPAFLAVQKQGLPTFKDKPEVAQYKVNSAIEIGLASAFDGIGTLNKEHRALLANRVIKEFPELNDHPIFGPKIHNFIVTGNWNPGDLDVSKFEAK